VQDLSLKYTARLADAGLVPSVGSVGDSYENALAETINGLYKAEVVHRRGPWHTLESALRLGAACSDGLGQHAQRDLPVESEWFGSLQRFAAGSGASW